MTEQENAALVIKEGMTQVFRPYQELIQHLLGPAATEVGLAFGDSVRVWRWKRQFRLLDKIKEMTEERHIKGVSPRLCFSILDAASIEEDDDMQDRWAALLANEALNTNSVHPSFVETLKQMLPVNARLLDKLYDSCTSRKTSEIKLGIWAEPHLDDNESDALGDLFRLGLLETTYDLTAARGGVASGPRVFIEETKLHEHYSLTSFAYRFVEVCRSPKKEQMEASESA